MKITLDRDQAVRFVDALVDIIRATIEAEEFPESNHERLDHAQEDLIAMLTGEGVFAIWNTVVREFYTGNIHQIETEGGTTRHEFCFTKVKERAIAFDDYSDAVAWVERHFTAGAAAIGDVVKIVRLSSR